ALWRPLPKCAPVFVDASQSTIGRRAARCAAGPCRRPLPPVVLWSSARGTPRRLSLPRVAAQWGRVPVPSVRLRMADDAAQTAAGLVSEENSHVRTNRWLRVRPLD